MCVEEVGMDERVETLLPTRDVHNITSSPL